ncbi:hypothetical protein BH09DEP1_BH09DEP1_1870 [soil metagenome]
MFGFAAADLFTTYFYSVKNTNAGQKATTGVFSVGTDATILTTGAYQLYLGISNWDNKAKAADAQTATTLVAAHPVVQAAVPAAARAALSSRRVAGV